MSDFVETGTNADGHTRFGMRWGPLEVERMSLLPEERRVLGLVTPRDRIHVYCTRTGLLRVFRNNEELKAPVAAAVVSTEPTP